MGKLAGRPQLAATGWTASQPGEQASAGWFR